MKKSDVKLGNTYQAKVSGRVVDVRVDAESPHGGWTATNLATGKRIRINSAQRLRPGGRAAASAGRTPRISASAARAEGAARTKRERAAKADVTDTAAPDGERTAGRRTPTRKARDATAADVAKRCAGKRGAPGTAGKDHKAAATRTNARRSKAAGKQTGSAKRSGKRRATEPKPSKRMGALEAAAHLLAHADGPMRCADMVDQMTKRGLWTSPAGKTPAATLNAAIIREIARKGRDSRFVKAGRGLYAASGAGAA